MNYCYDFVHHPPQDVDKDAFRFTFGGDGVDAFAFVHSDSVCLRASIFTVIVAWERRGNQSTTLEPIKSSRA